MTAIIKVALISVAMVAIFGAGLSYGERSMSESIEEILLELNPCTRSRG